MTEQHPILPSEELVKKWVCATGKGGYGYDSVRFYTYEQSIADQAARWGAEQRLEAVCEYIAGEGRWFAVPEFRLAELREAMDPKPPSLAEQALVEIQEMEGAMYSADLGCDFTATRAALERLQELDKGNE